jgi:hypothetical protein
MIITGQRFDGENGNEIIEKCKEWWGKNKDKFLKKK